MADDKKTSLKSSFDLAMERLAGREGQGKCLSDQQKKAIAGVQQNAKVKTAELEIMLNSRLAQAGDDMEKAEKIKSNHQREIAKIREKAEEEKERIRQERDKGA